MFFFLFVFNSLVFADFNGSITIEAIIDTTDIDLNDSLRVDFKIVFIGDQNDINMIEPAIPEVTNFDIIGSGSTNEVEPGKIIKKYFYYLKPQGIGMGYIEPIKFGYEDKSTAIIHNLKTKRLNVEIHPAEAEENHSFHFAYILLIVFIIIGGIGYVLYKKRFSNQQYQQEKTIIQSPLEQAKAELEKVKDEKTERKNIIFDTYSIILRYLRCEFEFPAGISGRDIVLELKKMDINETTVLEIQDFFDQCDLFKFSGGQLSSLEIDEIIFKAKEILRNGIKQ